MDPFLHDLWQLVSQPSALRENLAQIVETLGAGYMLGGLEWVQRNFEKVVIGIVIVSVLPIVWEWWKARSTRRAAATGR